MYEQIITNQVKIQGMPRVNIRTFYTFKRESNRKHDSLGVRSHFYRLKMLCVITILTT